MIFALASWSTDLDGVIPNVVFTLQLQLFASDLPLNQNMQLIHSLLTRIERTTGNGIFMSSSHWPIYDKLYPGWHPNFTTTATLVGAFSMIVKTLTMVV